MPNESRIDRKPTARIPRDVSTPDRQAAWDAIDRAAMPNDSLSRAPAGDGAQTMSEKMLTVEQEDALPPFEALRSALASAEALAEEVKAEKQRFNTAEVIWYNGVEFEANERIKAEAEVARLSERVAALEGALRNIASDFANSAQRRFILPTIDRALGDATGGGTGKNASRGEAQ